MSEMTPYEIEEYIEKVYPKVKDLVKLAGMTKEQWIEEAVKGPKKLFVRCENCKKWPCEAIESLTEEYPLLVKVWYEHGCACHDFSPNIEAHAEEKVDAC